MGKKGEERRNLKDLLAAFEKCEHNWLNQLGESSRRRYPLYWQEFKEWLVSQGYDWGAKGSEILKRRSDDLMLRREDPARWRFEDIGKRYYKWLYKDRRHENPTNTDNFKLTVVRSFFAHHRMALEYTRKEIEPLLNEIPPVPIDIITDKISGLIAHPCLDRDAIKAAKEWLATRDDDNPYMLPSQTVADGKPMTEKAINEAVKRVAELCHKINARTFRYEERGEGLRFHRFRKFLTTALKYAKVDEDFQDYIIGHKQTGTKKAYTDDERVQAYKFAEAYLLLPIHERFSITSQGDTGQNQGVVTTRTT